MLKSLLAVSMALAPVAADQDAMVFVHFPLVHKVSCFEGSGTAFRVGRNHWYSVAHVTAMHACSIDGQDVTVTEQDGKNDFSRLDTPFGASNGFTVDCRGFVPGHWYYGIGHARGMEFQTAIAVYATYLKAPNGQRVLIGPYDFIPGMSGGPVVDPTTGAVVGTVNAYIPGSPISLSREMKDTSVCQ